MDSKIEFNNYSADELGLSTKAYNILLRNVQTVGEFAKLSEADIRNFRGVGETTIKEFIEFAKKINVVLAKDTRSKEQILDDKGRPNAGKNKAWQKGVRENPYKQLLNDLVGNKYRIKILNELNLTDEQLKSNIDCVIGHLKERKTVGSMGKSDAKIVAQVAELRYGLNGTEPLTYKEISEIVGCDAGAKMQQFQHYMNGYSIWKVVSGQLTWEEMQQEQKEYLERKRQQEAEESEEAARKHEEWKKMRAEERKKRNAELKNAKLSKNNPITLGEDE